MHERLECELLQKERYINTRVRVPVIVVRYVLGNVLPAGSTLQWGTRQGLLRLSLLSKAPAAKAAPLRSGNVCMFIRLSVT